MPLITSQKLRHLEEVTNKEPYTLEPLGKDTDLYCQIYSDFENAGLVINDVEELKSCHNRKKYTTNRKLIEERNPQSADFKLNETYLYHGTQAEKYKLCEEGFDVNLASEGCFGRGLYFSDNPKKCEKYSKGSGTILVARVILGTVKEYPDSKRDQLLVREPEKENPTADEWRFYDSVKGRPRNHTEYVVYRNERALIEYIVTFSKAGDTIPAPSPSPVPQPTDADIPKPEAVSCDDIVVDSKPESETDETSSKTSKKADSDSDSDTDDDFFDAHDNDDDDKDLTDAKSKDMDSSSSDDDEDFTDVPTNIAEKAIIRDSLIPYFVLPSEQELSTEQKKKEFFKKVTLESDDNEVDSILKATDQDVERAIYLFYARKQVREEEEKRQRGEPVDDDVIEDDGAPIFPLMEPEYESDSWNQLTEDEKKSRMDKMVANFLLITALEELHIQIATDHMSQAKYDLDKAVISYYSAWF